MSDRALPGHTKMACPHGCVGWFPDWYLRGAVHRRRCHDHVAVMWPTTKGCREALEELLAARHVVEAAEDLRAGGTAGVLDHKRTRLSEALDHYRATVEGSDGE